MTPTIARRAKRRRPINSSARDDELGLLALGGTYAAPTRSEILAARTTDLDLVAHVRARLTAAGDAEGLHHLDHFSRPELVILAHLERGDHHS